MSEKPKLSNWTKLSNWRVNDNSRAAGGNEHRQLVNYSVKRKENKWATKGSMKFRVPKPCKYSKLFLEGICARCGKNVPEGQEMCSCGEKLQDCWSHKTNSCIYVHPDEPEWEAACDGTLAYNRQQQKFILPNQPLEIPFTIGMTKYLRMGKKDSSGMITWLSGDLWENNRGSKGDYVGRLLKNGTINTEPLKALNTRSRFTVNKRSPQKYNAMTPEESARHMAAINRRKTQTQSRYELSSLEANAKKANGQMTANNLMGGTRRNKKPSKKTRSRRN